MALVGFSQGTMMALHVGLRRPAPIAGIVGYSGLLAGPEHLSGPNVRKTPVLLVHGDADPIIPVVALHAAVQSLGAAGFLTEWHVSPGLAHGIDEAGLRLGADFLRRVLAG
jgi:phospholipase/carboxylesterase